MRSVKLSFAFAVTGMIMIVCGRAAFCEGIWDELSRNFPEAKDGYLLQSICFGSEVAPDPLTKAVQNNGDRTVGVELAQGGNPGNIHPGPRSKGQGPGHYRAVYKLKASDSTLDDVVAILEVSNRKGAVVSEPLEIKGKDFKAADKYQEFSVDFEIPEQDQPLMFYNLCWTGKCDLRLHTIKIFQKEDEVRVPSSNEDAVELKLKDKRVLFYASFDDTYHADYAVGSNRGVLRRVIGHVPGKKGKAVSLNYGSCYYSGKGNIDPKQGTMMVWVKPSVPADQWATDSIMLAKNLVLYYHPRMKAFGFFIDQPGLFYSAEVGGEMWPAEMWHHLAVTWDKTGGRAIYLDGDRSAASGQASGIGSCDIFSIGKGSPASWHYFKGALDEMYIFDKVLSADEIKMIFERQNASEIDIGDL